MTDTILEVVSAVLLLFGSALALTAAIGVLRFPDVLSRMHAATKPQSLGILCVVIGAAIELRGSVDVWMLALTCIFQLLTAPLAAHLVGGLAYKRGNVRHDLLLTDDLRDARKTGHQAEL